jgi:hypothetical protein
MDPARRGHRVADLPRPERVDRIRHVLPGYTGSPPAPGLTTAQFGWALAIGAAAAIVSFGIRWLALFLRPHVERRLLLLTPLAGLVIAGLAIAFAEATGKPSSAVLFSGQTALTPLLENAASYTAGTRCC